jgi:hypothetical protein
VDLHLLEGECLLVSGLHWITVANELNIQKPQRISARGRKGLL